MANRKEFVLVNTKVNAAGQTEAKHIISIIIILQLLVEAADTLWRPSSRQRDREHVAGRAYRYFLMGRR
jgi:hypothetical protein